MTPRFRILCAPVLCFVLAGCAIGPDHVAPSVETPAAFKEGLGAWHQVSPVVQSQRGPWWESFGDAQLNALERQVVISNQTVKAQEAAMQVARAAVAESQAALFPSLTSGVSDKRSGTGRPHDKPTTSYAQTNALGWEIDVWGKLRRGVESDEALAQASEADFAAALLSTQAQLATTYFSVRSQDALIQLLDEAVMANAKLLQIAESKYNAGMGDRADVASARTQVESARAEATNAHILRAQLEHAIAVLIGKAPSDYNLPSYPSAAVILDVSKGMEPLLPAEVPSTLLERRPDIAAAERRVAAANAQIGAAQAAYFPDLTLSTSYGFASSAMSKLFQASSGVWAFGPTIAATLFDGGARSARVDQARGAHEQSIANYRETVLESFQDVEDQLAALRYLTDQISMQQAAVASARDAETLRVNQYQAGVASLSDTLLAKTTRLSSEKNFVSIYKSQRLAAIALVKALGGGWRRETFVP